MLNQHITDYLQYYVDSKKSPDHAVMLNGPWGSGKTWFIKEFVKNFTSAHEEGIKFFHVSLYGLKSIEEIVCEIFKQAHPKWFSKKALFGAGALKAIINGNNFPRLSTMTGFHFNITINLNLQSW